MPKREAAISQAVQSKFWSARRDGCASPTKVFNVFAATKDDFGDPPVRGEAGRCYRFEEMRFRQSDAILTIFPHLSEGAPNFRDQKGEVPRGESGGNAQFAIRCASKRIRWAEFLD